MTMRLALFAVFATLANAPAPVAPVAATKASTVVAPKDDVVRVTLDTAMGRIVLALDRKHAPLTTANFLRYIDAKRFDAITFYRAMPVGAAAGDGLIQGGITRDVRLLYPPIAHEPTDVTGLHHDAGAIAMASFAPGTARADFFILASAIPAFDAKPPSAGSAGAPGFAVFGRVVEGMEVVKAILAAPTDPAKGIGPMKGQMIADPVIIRTARRVAK